MKGIWRNCKYFISPQKSNYRRNIFSIRCFNVHPFSGLHKYFFLTFFLLLYKNATVSNNNEYDFTFFSPFLHLPYECIMIKKTGSECTTKNIEVQWIFLFSLYYFGFCSSSSFLILFSSLGLNLWFYIILQHELWLCALQGLYTKSELFWISLQRTKLESTWVYHLLCGENLINSKKGRFKNCKKKLSRDTVNLQWLPGSLRILYEWFGSP